jgi:hypothetical protein
MITYTPGEGGGSGIALVSFAWPTNDTGGKTLRVMQDAAVGALRDAGYTSTVRPAFHALVPAEGGGYTFQFTAPAAPPEPAQEVAP